MANPNTPLGLVAYRDSGNKPYSAGGNIFYVPASIGSNLFIGDPVALALGADTVNGYPTLALATAGAGNAIIGSIDGIVQGGDPENPTAITRDLPVYHQASTAGYVLVADDPAVLFAIQEDSVGGALTATAAGYNANLVSGAGSTFTGQSGWQLQSSSAATGNTNYQLKILKLLQRADNALGVNAKWLVKINNHGLAGGTAGV